MLILNRSNFQAHPFHWVSPSPWPLNTFISLLCHTTSAGLSFHGFAYAVFYFMLNFTALILYMSFLEIHIYYLKDPLSFANIFALVLVFSICISEELLRGNFILINMVNLNNNRLITSKRDMHLHLLLLRGFFTLEVYLVKVDILKAIYRRYSKELKQKQFSNMVENNRSSFWVNTTLLHDTRFNMVSQNTGGLLSGSNSLHHFRDKLVKLVKVLEQRRFIHESSPSKTLSVLRKGSASKLLFELEKLLIKMEFKSTNETQLAFEQFCFYQFPTKVLLSSNNILMSGFYTGKGKGKASVVSSDEEKKAKSDSESEGFDSDDQELRKAIALSLQQEKRGESSKNKPDNTERDEFEIVSGYTQSWKTLKDQFKSKARLHNDTMIKLEKQNTKDKADIDKLTKYSEDTKQLKLEISIVEKKLLQFGVDPSEQFNYQPESDTDSDSSVYSSDTGLKRKYSSSDNSDTRQNKTVKYLNPDNNTDMTPVFSIYKVGLNFSWIVRFLSVIPSGIFLLVIHLNVFPNLIIPFININLTQLLSLYLIVSLIKWIYKLYNTIIVIYNSYLKKDYLILYTNFYFTSILIIVLLSNNLDIGIFYF